MRKSIILRYRNLNKTRFSRSGVLILVGILALGLILLAGCRQRPKEVELEKKELIPLEEMVPLEPMAEKAPMVAEAPPAVAPTPYAPAAVTGKININTATQAQLESISGIGPAKAQLIIAGRPYSSPEEITKVKGISPKMYEALKDKITVGGAAAPAAAPTVAPAVAPTPVASAVVAGKININTATQAQLESLPGIGPATAKAIIANRPYSSIEDITRATRFGPNTKTYENLKNLITVE